jgi:hypothetical protein
MVKDEFEATWIPRIGTDATAELRRFRRTGGFGLVAPVLGAAAAVLFGNGPLEDLLAAIPLAAGIAVVVSFIRGQRRLALALSRWFGVWITAGQLPPMSTKRFDAWRERRGLRSANPTDNLHGTRTQRSVL